jgi:hydroxymethylpyrimidine/phosphomethylpyrimidine kinase
VPHLVVDPVMVATSGGSLAAEGLLPALRARAFPLATVVTPNWPEGEAIAGERLDPADPERSALRVLAASGARAVLLKGGHGAGSEAVDALAVRDAGSRTHFVSGGVWRFALPRVPTDHGHGAGCALAASIACRLARGDDLLAAVRGAKAYVHRALAAAGPLGVGRGPVRHAVPAD